MANDRVRRIFWDAWGSPDEEDDYLSSERREYSARPEVFTQGVQFVDGLPTLPDFDYRVMHTNFRLTKPELEKLLSVEGVECVPHTQAISFYRVRVAFGKLFDEESVKKDVERVLISPEGKPLSRVELLRVQGLPPLGHRGIQFRQDGNHRRT